MIPFIWKSAKEGEMKVHHQRVHSMLCCIVVALAVALGTGMVFGQAVHDGKKQRKIESLLAQGDELLRAGQFERAEKKYRQARDYSDGSEPGAFLGLARTHLYALEYAEAIKSASVALQLSSDPEAQAQAHNIIGSAYFHRCFFSTGFERDEQDLTMAEEAFRQALELSSGSANVMRFNLAYILDMRGQREEALAFLKDYLERGASPGEENMARRLLCLLEEEMSDSPPVPPRLPIIAPVKIHDPQPEYTEAARRAGVQGVVIAQTLVDKDGDVECLRVLKGLPAGLTQVAVDTMLQWKYKPATLHGEPVKVYYNMTVNFRLQ